MATRVSSFVGLIFYGLADCGFNFFKSCKHLLGGPSEKTV
jgi:hypothetical protein